MLPIIIMPSTSNNKENTTLYTKFLHSSMILAQIEPIFCKRVFYREKRLVAPKLFHNNKRKFAPGLKPSVNINRVFSLNLDGFCSFRAPFTRLLGGFTTELLTSLAVNFVPWSIFLLSLLYFWFIHKIKCYNHDGNLR